MLKRKILVISNSSEISGAEKSLLTFAQNVDKNRFTLVFLLPAKTGLYHLLNNDFDVMISEGGHSGKIGSAWSLLRYLFSVVVSSVQVLRICRKKKIDLILANTVKAGIFGLLSKVVARVKIICVVRDNVRFRAASKVFFTLTDHLICISDHIYRQVSCPPSRKSLVYPAVGIEQQDNGRDLRKELNLCSDTFVIGNIGQYTPWKNHMDFIRVATELLKNRKKIHFVLIGSCLCESQQKYRQSLIRYVEENEIQQSFSFLTFRQDIESVFAALNLLIHCAQDEPFGRVVAEAVGYGIPVIAYNKGGPAEIIQHGKTGYLVDAGDIGKMADLSNAIIGNRTSVVKRVGKLNAARFDVVKSTTAIEKILIK